MDAFVKAALNLAEVGQMFPMQGVEMKGIFSANATIKGVYDSIKKQSNS